MFTKTGTEKRSEKLHKAGGTTVAATVLEYHKGMTYGVGGEDSGSVASVVHYSLKVRIEPDGDAPFEAKVKATNADTVHFGKFQGAFHVVPQEGDEIAVIYDPTDHSKVAIDLSPPAEFLARFKPQRVADSDFASANASFAALIKQHDVHLGAQSPKVRATIEADLKAAGVPLQPGGVLNFTDRAQIEAVVEVFKKHALLPPDAAIK